MTMKRICFLLLFAMTAAVSAAAAKPAATPATTTAKPAVSTTTAKPAEAAKPAAATTSKSAETVLTRIYSADRDPSEFADPEKAEALLKERTEIVQKIQDERKRLLKEDEAAKKLHEEIMELSRRLASLLENKPSMVELNHELRRRDDAISKLKPASVPETETKDTKKEDAGKAGKE